MCDDLFAHMSYVNVYLTNNVCLHKTVQNMSAVRENGGNGDTHNKTTQNKNILHLPQLVTQQF